MKDTLKSLAFTAGLCVIAAGFAFYATPSPVRHPMPRFIAHACDGAGGDLWAMDASDFPTRCKEIEEY